MKSWPRPQVVVLLGQQVPDQDRELSGGRDRCDVLAAARLDAQKERPQLTGRPRGGPGRFHEQAPRMTWALLCDAAVIGRRRAGLPDAGVENEVADELLGRAD